MSNIESANDGLVEKSTGRKIKSPMDAFVIPEGYSKEIPIEEGAYWVICMESDYKREPVEIIRKKGELMADDPDLGIVPLDHYHNGLTEICWRKDSHIT